MMKTICHRDGGRSGVELTSLDENLHDCDAVDVVCVDGRRCMDVWDVGEMSVERERELELLGRRRRKWWMEEREEGEGELGSW